MKRRVCNSVGGMGQLLKSIYLMKLWGQTCESVWTQEEQNVKRKADGYTLVVCLFLLFISCYQTTWTWAGWGVTSTSQGVAWFNQLASVQHYGMTHAPREKIHSCLWALVGLLGYDCHKKKEMEQRYSCVFA